MKSSLSHPSFVPLSGLCGLHVWQWGQSFRVALIAELSTVVRIRVANSFDHHQIPIQGLIMLLFFILNMMLVRMMGMLIMIIG